MIGEILAKRAKEKNIVKKFILIEVGINIMEELKLSLKL